jgi:hypothetical protein
MASDAAIANPAGGRIAVGEVLEHAQRRQDIELAATERLRRPHPEDPLTQERIDDRLRENALLVSLLSVFIS